jgi:hypothetical protein
MTLMLPMQIKFKQGLPDVRNFIVIGTGSNYCPPTESPPIKRKSPLTSRGEVDYIIF